MHKYPQIFFLYGSDLFFYYFVCGPEQYRSDPKNTVSAVVVFLCDLSLNSYVKSMQLFSQYLSQSDCLEVRLL